MPKNEFCIMPYTEIAYTYNGVTIGAVCSNVRTSRYCHRHEIFFGTANRQKSIKYGLVVFLTPEHHNMSSYGVHRNREFDLKLKQLGQKVAMDYYGWSVEDFIREFGKSYL